MDGILILHGYKFVIYEYIWTLILYMITQFIPYVNALFNFECGPHPFLRVICRVKPSAYKTSGCCRHEDRMATFISSSEVKCWLLRYSFIFGRGESRKAQERAAGWLLQNFLELQALQSLLCFSTCVRASAIVLNHSFKPSQP